MTARRQLLIWVVAAFAASTLLVAVLWREYESTRSRWTTFLVGDPSVGAKLFFEKKGCAQCHPANGVGGNSAPDLGFAQSPQSSLSQLVACMWNCAPRMWERMRAARMHYPDLNQEEMAHLFAFLYTARYVDEPGDKDRGERLLATKGCIRCHAVEGRGGEKGPDFAALSGLDTPIRWTQAMWNHAPAMEAGMQELKLAWPKFDGRDMNDLLAYIREVSRGPRAESGLLPANPENGWKLFQSKSCIVCHAVRGKGGRIGPELGPGREIPLTFVQFAGLMWNHSPEMLRELKARGIPRPTLDGKQIADLVAFLASLRYFEPGGSPHIGESLFAERGCGRCHGPSAEGTRQGPALRGRGQSYHSIGLATALWSHGPGMYRRTRELGVSWPTLVETDVGSLVTFLNAPLEGNR